MYSYILILIFSFTMILCRFLPFILFKNNVPDFIMYLGKVLPISTMSLLVIYCFRDINFTSVQKFVPQILATVLTLCSYKYKKSLALSIILGTIFYMFLIQVIFI